MSYILQPQLFTYDQFVGEHDDNERLVLTLSALPDEKLLCWLSRQRKGRRDKYPLGVLWRCLIAKFVYQVRTYAELIRELRRNGSLRRLMGIDSREAVPQDYHFSRLLKKLSCPEGQRLVEEMFHVLVERLGEALPGLGQHLAVDGTAIHAYSNELRREKSDPDGAWSARPKRQRRGGPNSEKKEYIDFWFGYLLHLVVDCETELPVGFELTPANENESPHFEPLLEDFKRRHGDVAERTQAVLADAGYDSRNNCAYVLDEYGALPIIKMRLTQDKDKVCQAADSLCTELGTQICPSGYKMVYDGRDGNYLKWRCPVARGKADECKCMGRCTASAYGAVRKIAISEDPRRYPGLWRESRKWKRLYRRRTAVERVNGRLKDFLLLDQLTVRGIEKVRLHATMGLVMMQAGAWAMVSAEKVEQARRIVSLAA